MRRRQVTGARWQASRKVSRWLSPCETAPGDWGTVQASLTVGRWLSLCEIAPSDWGTVAGIAVAGEASLTVSVAV